MTRLHFCSHLPTSGASQPGPCTHPLLVSLSLPHWAVGCGRPAPLGPGGGGRAVREQGAAWSPEGRRQVAGPPHGPDHPPGSPVRRFGWGRVGWEASSASAAGGESAWLRRWWCSLGTKLQQRRGDPLQGGGKEKNQMAWSCFLSRRRRWPELLRGRSPGASVHFSGPCAPGHAGCQGTRSPCPGSPGLHLVEAERAGAEIIPNICFILHQSLHLGCGLPSPPELVWRDRCWLQTATRWQYRAPPSSPEGPQGLEG